MLLALFLPLLLLTGCQKPMNTPTRSILEGDFATPRVQIYDNMVDDRGNRRYLLDRMRVGVLTLADGYPQSAQFVFEEVYDVLRTQGINKDKTVASVVLNEDLKIWKGEPFEQALALAYYAMAQAETGSWDNCRAAANNSLFYLRDFGENEEGERIDTYEIARRSLIYERAVAEGATEEEALEKANYLNEGYVPRESNFTLGYLLHGIASQQLDREDEAEQYFRRVLELDSTLEPLVTALRSEQYNTILVVSYGLGPRKEGYGPHRSLARFAPRTPSDRAALRLSIDAYAGRTYPLVSDVNTMAADHMWNNLEDVRKAKATLGNVLLTGGALATVYGLDRGSDEAVYAGLGALAAGAFLSAGAHVDVRYCDVMPQRFYVVPLNIVDPDTMITMQVEGKPGTRLRLKGLGAPPRIQTTAQLRYVRLLDVGSEQQLPQWAVRGELLYSTPDVRLPQYSDLPYILGGRSVRQPTEDALDDYQAAGYLQGYTLSELLDLYRAENIRLTTQDQAGYAGKHVLEGGKSLVSPLPGTTGFMRLFAGEHPPYQPSNPQVKQAINAVRP